MLELRLEDLFTEETLMAFRKQWHTDPELSAADARAIVEVLTAPKTKQERRIAWLVTALVGPKPDFHAWLEALAVGSFKIRDSVSYAIGRVNESPAKFIARQRKRVDDLIDHSLPEVEKADYRNAYEDAMRLVLASTLLKQTRMGIAARAAIGPGWPIMAGVWDNCTTEVQRYMHRFGADEDLQRAVAQAAETALRDWLAARFGTAIPAPSTKININASLPNGVNAAAYFQREEDSVRQYRDRLLRILQVPIFRAQQCGLSELARDDAGIIKAALMKPARSFSYLIDQNGNAIRAIDYTEEELERIVRLFPLLVGTPDPSLVRAAALRAYGRNLLRNRQDALPADGARASLENEICEWVTRGNPPPPNLRLGDAALFEEEVCRVLVGGGWHRLTHWRKLGFLLEPVEEDPLFLDMQEAELARLLSAGAPHA